MYGKILAAINEHVNSEVAARYALQFAKKANARIYFCAIAGKGLDEKNFQTAEDAVKRLFQRAKGMDVRADCILETGAPVEQINKLVKTEGMDIVFAATRHEDVEKRFYAHTLAQKLSLTLPCSMALVHVVHMGRLHPRTILVPLKARMDHIAERARFSALMAGAFDAGIHLFHSARPLKSFFHGEVHLTPREWEARLPDDINRFIHHLEQFEVTPEKKLLSGGAGRNIAIEAAAKRHDLIIMGASQRNLLSSLFRGNPVECVLRETTCDLIILRPRK